ncbi:hypothetical protein AAVH_26585 [Aphelenchoides avenae]|nr:hypothetical protein AAVH_26585 [Aphelenchus avenae]
MSKLFVAVVAFSICVADHNPKIKLLSNPGVKGAYSGDDTNYDDLLKPLAAVQDLVTVHRVKESPKEHAPKLFQRVEAAEAAFKGVVAGDDNIAAKDFVRKVGGFIEKYYLVGLLINEKAKEGEKLHKLYDELNDWGKKVVGEKLKEAAEAVEKALYKH